MSRRKLRSSAKYGDDELSPTVMAPPRPSSGSPSSSSTREPANFLPTTLEAALLTIYPVTLLLGSLSSHLSPTTRNAPYSHTTQSHPPEFAPSYFARKNNMFNLYFVKIGWFWISVAVGAFAATHSLSRQRRSSSGSSRGSGASLGTSAGSGRRILQLQILLRWALATAFWVLITQWFFGPALIDRGFRLTGGQCFLDVETYSRGKAESSITTNEEIFTAVACKSVGGTWRGGVDVSGHVFLLILGSGVILFETLPYLISSSASSATAARNSSTTGGDTIEMTPATSTTTRRKSQDAGDQGRDSIWLEKMGTRFALAIAALSWWMLLMTAVFFHTWTEKLSGLVLAFDALWVIYLAPRGWPAMRNFVGLPASSSSSSSSS